jgi:hypothetical protein
MSGDVYLILLFYDISHIDSLPALASASVPLASVPILGIRYDRLSGAGLAFHGGGCTSPLGGKGLKKRLESLSNNRHVIYYKVHFSL